MAYSVGQVRIVDIHKMAPKPDDRFREKEQPTIPRNLTIARIRVLLAPNMSPYVLPMEKVRTWEMLVNMLEKLFGKQHPLDQLRITDGQGNLILQEVWEDLLEPGMTVVVDTRPMNGGNGRSESTDYGRRPEPTTTRNSVHNRHSSLTFKVDFSTSERLKFAPRNAEAAQLPPMEFETVREWAYSPSTTSTGSRKTTTSNGKEGRQMPTKLPSPPPKNDMYRPAVPPSLPASALSQIEDINQSIFLAPARPPRPPALSPLVIPGTRAQVDNPMHTMTLSLPAVAPVSSKERFSKTGGRFTAHFQALLSKRPSPREPTSAVSPPSQQLGLLERWKPIENNPRKQSLSRRRGLESPIELVVSSKPAEAKQEKSNIIRRAKSLGNIQKDDLRIRHQASPSLPYIPPVPVLRLDATKPYIATTFTNPATASSAASRVTYGSFASTQPTSAESSPVQTKPEPLQSTTYNARPPSRSAQTPSPQSFRLLPTREASRSPPLSRPSTRQSNTTPLRQSGPPPSKPLPKLPPALSAFPAPGPPPPLTKIPLQLLGPPMHLDALAQPMIPTKTGKRIGIMGNKKTHKPRAESIAGLGLGIVIDGEVSPKDSRRERREEKEKEKKEKKEKSKGKEKMILKPLNIEGGRTVAVSL